MRLQYANLVNPQIGSVNRQVQQAPQQSTQVPQYGATPGTAIGQGITNLSKQLIPVFADMKRRQEEFDQNILKVDKGLNLTKARTEFSQYFVDLSFDLEKPKALKQRYPKLYQNREPTSSELWSAIQSDYEKKRISLAKTYGLDDSHQEEINTVLGASALEPGSKIRETLVLRQTEESLSNLNEYRISEQRKAINGYGTAEGDFAIENYKNALSFSVSNGVIDPKDAVIHHRDFLSKIAEGRAIIDASLNPRQFLKNHKEGKYFIPGSLNGTPMQDYALVADFGGSPSPEVLSNLFVQSSLAVRNLEEAEGKKSFSETRENQLATLSLQVEVKPGLTLKQIDDELKFRSDPDNKGMTSEGNFSHLSTEKLTATSNSIKASLGKKGLTSDETFVLRQEEEYALKMAYKEGQFMTTLMDKPEGAEYAETERGKAFKRLRAFVMTLGMNRMDNSYISGDSEGKVVPKEKVPELIAAMRQEYDSLDPIARNLADPYFQKFIDEMNVYVSTSTAEIAEKIQNSRINQYGGAISNTARNNEFIDLQNQISGGTTPPDPADYPRVGLQILPPSQTAKYKGFVVQTVADLQELYKMLYNDAGAADYNKRTSQNNRDAVSIIRQLQNSGDWPLNDVMTLMFLNPAVRPDGTSDPVYNSDFFTDFSNLGKDFTFTQMRKQIRLSGEFLDSKGMGLIEGFTDSADRRQLAGTLATIAQNMMRRASPSGQGVEDVDAALEDGSLDESDYKEYLGKAYDYMIGSRFYSYKNAKGHSVLFPKSEFEVGLVNDDPVIAQKQFENSFDLITGFLGADFLAANKSKNLIIDKFTNTLRQDLPTDVLNSIKTMMASTIAKVSNKYGSAVVEDAIGKGNYRFVYDNDSSGSGVSVSLVLFNPEADPNDKIVLVPEQIMNSNNEPLVIRYGTIQRLMHSKERHDVINAIPSILSGLRMTDSVSGFFSSIADMIITKGDGSTDTVKNLSPYERLEAFSVDKSLQESLFNVYETIPTNLRAGGFSSGGSPFSFPANVNPILSWADDFTFMTPNFLIGRAGRQVVGDFTRYLKKRYGDNVYKLSDDDIIKEQKKFMSVARDYTENTLLYLQRDVLKKRKVPSGVINYLNNNQ